MTTEYVAVNDDHLLQARALTNYDNPLSLALQDAGYEDAGVGTDTAWLTPRKHDEFPLGNRAQEFIRWFNFVMAPAYRPTEHQNATVSLADGMNRVSPGFVVIDRKAKVVDFQPSV